MIPLIYRLVFLVSNGYLALLIKFNKRRIYILKKRIQELQRWSKEIYFEGAGFGRKEDGYPTCLQVNGVIIEGVTIAASSAKLLSARLEGKTVSKIVIAPNKLVNIVAVASGKALTDPQ